MLISIKSIISFLQDEGLGPLKIKKDDEYAFEILINEPHIWGTNDTKYRCGITAKITINNNGSVQQHIVFNSFKARAILGDQYCGTFYQFVKLVKNFNSITTAQQYFLEKYVLSHNTDLSVITDASPIYSSTSSHTQKILHSVNLPTHYIKFDYSVHKEYTNYLLQRGVAYDVIKNIKLFINPKEKRLVFPIYENGILIFYIERDITNINPIRWKKNKGENIYPIWNLENVSGTIVYVFEGIFDAIHFPSGIALLGVGNKQQFNKIIKRGFSKINLIFDNDNAGRNARYKWAKWLTSRDVKNVYIFNYNGIREKDFSELFEKNIHIDINDRLLLWDDSTEIKFKLGLIQ